jgi:predicted P-loop ATPase
VVTGCIDIDALRRDRDQLFAEAVVRYDQGERWWPEAQFERAIIEPQQAARYESDAWADPIVEYLARVTDPLTLSQVAQNVLQLETRRIGTADQRRIANIMEGAGWRRLKKHSHGRPWWRADDAPPSGYSWP